ncbi:MAG: pirin family protein, partial [Burkholderiales bacterium]|nr:pirin family protein [Burkholderiales bacterium]
MVTIRKSSERGHANHGWLEARHSFSFAGYQDPEHMGFGPLRVINEDRVQAGRGFGSHGHRDMEIITYILDGALAHKDSMGNGSTIRPGDVQRMSAGRGVMHSEFNPSKDEPTHLLQIWIEPDRRGVEPSYEETHFPAETRQGRLRLIASNDGREGSVTIHQDAAVYATLLDGDETVRQPVAPGRRAYVHVARGEVVVNGQPLSAGDALKAEDEHELVL